MIIKKTQNLIILVKYNVIYIYSEKMALIFSLILLRINKCIKNANENNQIFRKRLEI